MENPTNDFQVPDESERFYRMSMDISDQIIDYLKKHDLDQKDLAKLLKKSESEISKWLCGHHNFTLRTLSKIESALKEDVVVVPKHAAEHSRVRYYMDLDYSQEYIAEELVPNFSICIGSIDHLQLRGPLSPWYAIATKMPSKKILEDKYFDLLPKKGEESLLMDS